MHPPRPLAWVSRARALVAGAALAVSAASPAFAAAELITNGSFDSWTVNNAASTTSSIVTGGQSSGTSGATLTGWTNTAYTFVYSSSSAASASGASNIYMWGPSGTTATTYADNGFTNTAKTTGTPSNSGASFIASDGAYQQGFISQTISNLVVGQSYLLSYYWAAAQQSGFNGTTSEGWNIYWGTSAPTSTSAAATASTGLVNMAEHGFTSWRQQTYTLVATSTSMVLSFMAIGTPGGSPPFSLLDSVSLQVPEPDGLIPFLAGGTALAGITLLRRRSSAAG